MEHDYVFLRDQIYKEHYKSCYDSIVRCKDSERYLSQEPSTSSEDRGIFIFYKLQDPVVPDEMVIPDSAPY